MIGSLVLFYGALGILYPMQIVYFQESQNWVLQRSEPAPLPEPGGPIHFHQFGPNGLDDRETGNYPAEIEKRGAASLVTSR